MLTKNMKKIALTLTCLVSLQSCGNKSSSDSIGVDFLSGHYAHQELLKTSVGSELFLINLKPQDGAYKVCFDQGLLNSRHQVTRIMDQEVVAALKIWGYYIRRNLPVELTKVALPSELASEQPLAYLERLATVCPTETNLIVGQFANTEHPLSTIYTGVQMGNQVRYPLRGLFFKRYAQNNPYKILDSANAWQSAKNYTADELLEMLKKRERIVYLPGEQQRLYSLSLLLHETGKIWGLCAPLGTNCDRNYHTGARVGSVMSGFSHKFQAYLGNDDINGIQALAIRPEFNNTGWPVNFDNNALVTPTRNRGEIPFFRINGVVLVGNTVTGSLGHEFAAAVTLRFKIFDSRYSEWLNVNQQFTIQPGDFAHNTRFQFNAPRDSRVTEGKVTLTTASGNTQTYSFTIRAVSNLDSSYFTWPAEKNPNSDLGPGANP